MSFIRRMSFATDTGKVRKRNEDCVLTLPNSGVAILADGMGGHQGGDVASRVAVDIISAQLTAEIESVAELPDDEWFLDTMQFANDSIVDQARDDPELAGMGSTLVLACYTDSEYIIVHVGDSRCYHFLDNEIELLTEDHTLAQHYVTQGILKPDEVKTWQGRNMLMRGLGIEGDVLPDIVRGSLSGNERFLLCSDGLTDVLEDQDIANHLSWQHNDPDQVVNELVLTANERGGPDNITVALIEFR